MAIAAGSDHSIVVLEDGSIRAFGVGTDGRLGYGSTFNVGDALTSTPELAGPVPVGGRAAAVAAGNSFSLVLLEDGSIRSFGSGTEGKLGYGDPLDVGKASLSWVTNGLPSKPSVVAVGSRMCDDCPAPIFGPQLLTGGFPSLPEAVAVMGLANSGVRLLPSSALISGVHVYSDAVVALPEQATGVAACLSRTLRLPSSAPEAAALVCDFETWLPWFAFEAEASLDDLAVNQTSGAGPLLFAPAGQSEASAVTTLYGSFGWLYALAAQPLQDGLDKGVVRLFREDRPDAGMVWPCRAVSLQRIECRSSPVGTGGSQSSHVELDAAPLGMSLSRVLPVASAFRPPQLTRPQTVQVPGTPGSRVRFSGQNFGVYPGRPFAVDVVGLGECGDATLLSDSTIECLPPLGVGARVNVTVTIDGQVSAAAPVLSYPAPAVTGISAGSILAGELVPELRLRGSFLGFEASQVEQVLIGGVRCLNVSVSAPSTELTCGSFQAPVVWPGAGTVSVTIGGQSNAGGTTTELFAAVALPRVDNASVVPGTDARPGSMVDISGARFSAAGVDVVAARFGGVVTTDCELLSGAQPRLRCRLPQATGRVLVAVLSRTGLWSPNGILPFDFEPPVVTSVRAALGDGDDRWETFALYSRPSDPPVRLQLGGVGLARSPLTGVRFGPTARCASLTVVNDSFATCTGLANGTDGDPRPLFGRLLASVQWPSEGAFVTESASASLYFMGRAQLDGVVPPLAAPGSSLVLSGRNFPPSLAAWKQLHVGGTPCGSPQVLGEQTMQCDLPASTTLAMLEDRSFDALHLRLVLATGMEVTMLSAVRLSGLVDVTWGGSAEPRDIVAMPSSADVSFPLEALALVLDGGGAMECRAERAGGAASTRVVGQSRTAAAPRASVLSLSSVAVAGNFGDVLELRAVCLTSTGSDASTLATRTVAFPNVSLVYDAGSNDWLSQASKVDPRLLPGLNVTIAFQGMGGAGMDAARVAAALRCEMTLSGRPTESGATITPVVGAGSTFRAAFAEVSLSGFALGSDIVIRTSGSPRKRCCLCQSGRCGSRRLLWECRQATLWQLLTPRTAGCSCSLACQASWRCRSWRPQVLVPRAASPSRAWRCSHCPAC